MLKGIILDTRWSHNQNLVYLGLPKPRRNPNKKKVSELMTIEDMKKLEKRAFGRPLF